MRDEGLFENRKTIEYSRHPNFSRRFPWYLQIQSLVFLSFSLEENFCWFTWFSTLTALFNSSTFRFYTFHSKWPRYNNLIPDYRKLFNLALFHTRSIKPHQFGEFDLDRYCKKAPTNIRLFGWILIFFFHGHNRKWTYEMVPNDNNYLRTKSRRASEYKKINTFPLPVLLLNADSIPWLYTNCLHARTNRKR